MTPRMRPRALGVPFALLLTACSAAPAAPPPPARTPALALGTPTPPDAPLDIPAGLGRSVLVTRPPPDGPALAFPPMESAATPTNVAGLFLLGLDTDRPPPPDGRLDRLSVRTHGCLLRGNPSCNYLRSGARAPDGSIRWRPFVAVPPGYDHLLLGRDRAFLRLEKAPGDVLAVDRDGQASVWMAAPEEPTTAETATWLLTDDQPVFAYRSDQEIVIHARASAGAPRRAPFLTRFVWLDYEQPVAGTRALARKGARFAYGLTLTTSLDAAGEPDPGLVAAWTEFLLPSSPLPAKAIGDDDPWVGIGMLVPRRLHLARIALDGRVTDHAELSAAATRALFAPEEEGYLVPPGPMSARPVPGGFVLQNAMIDGKFKPKPGLAPDPSPPPAFPALGTEALQRVCAAGYDAASREGLVVACEAGAAFAQRFDARGHLLGGPLELSPALGASLARRGLARLAGGWVGVASDGELVVGLSGALAGLRIVVQREAGPGRLSLVAAHDAGLDLFFVDEQSGLVRRTRVDLANRVARAPEPLTDHLDVPTAFVRSLASRRLIADPRGGQWLITKADDGYHALHRSLDETIDERRDLGKAVALDLIAVDDDVVAVLLRSGQDDDLQGIWLRDGHAAALPRGAPSSTAPLLSMPTGEAFFVLPGATPAVQLPRAIADDLFTADGIFPTGPRSAVVVGTAPPDGPRPGRRVILRALGVDAPPRPKAD